MPALAAVTTGERVMRGLPEPGQFLPESRPVISAWVPFNTLPSAEMTGWLEEWRQRLAQEAQPQSDRARQMRLVNPVFIPRNNRVQQAILFTAERELAMSNYLLDEASLSSGAIYRLFSGAIAPRPVAWVSTQDAEGHTNLAPFSFFNVVSVAPPVLGFSPLLDGEGQPKDTIRNLEQVPECVVHISGEALVEEMNVTSTSLPAGEDEFALAGLAKEVMPGLSVSRVAAAPVAFGCRLREIVRFGDQPMAGCLVLAEVVSIHIDDAIWNGRHVSVEVLKPIGRMAGSDYARTSDLFSLERPA